MRRTLVIALPLLAVTFAGCGGSHRAAASLRSTPSGFVVPSAVADPLCNGGRGIRVPAPGAGGSNLASGALPDGSTLVVLTSIERAKRRAIFHSFTRRCATNQAFGSGGVSTITIPSRLLPRHPTPFDSRSLWINVVAPRQGGGAIVAGSFGGGWVVGAVTARGRLDPSFGDHGWTVLASHGEVSAVLQEPSGRIVLGGEDSFRGNLAVALSAHGQVADGFGAHGRVRLLSRGPDSGVVGLALEPNGDILTDVVYGNNGCWGHSLAMLTPSGRSLPHFQQRLARFWKQLRFGAFMGGVYTDGPGFTLVGTGEPNCDSYRRQKVTELIARFRSDGRTVGRTIRYPSRMYGTIQAFRVGNETFVVEVPYADSTHITLAVRLPNGRLAAHGRTLIRTRWSGENAALGTTVSISRAGPRALMFVATRDGLDRLHLIRVRFGSGTRLRR